MRISSTICPGLLLLSLLIADQGQCQEASSALCQSSGFGCQNVFNTATSTSTTTFNADEQVLFALNIQTDIRNYTLQYYPRVNQLTELNFPSSMRSGPF